MGGGGGGQGGSSFASITAHKVKSLAIDTRRVKQISFFTILCLKTNSSKHLQNLTNKKQYKHLKPPATVDLQDQKVP